MFATGSILLREKADAIVVPAVSMRSDGMGDYVLKLQDGQLLRQAVTISSTWSGGKIVEIGTGLEAGETIITAPLSELRPGVAVSITASKAG
jgi:multidrug efflux pump subunit AcrA (membrane-fusion protein)